LLLFKLSSTLSHFTVLLVGTESLRESDPTEFLVLHKTKDNLEYLSREDEMDTGILHHAETIEEVPGGFKKRQCLEQSNCPFEPTWWC